MKFLPFFIPAFSRQIDCYLRITVTMRTLCDCIERREFLAGFLVSTGIDDDLEKVLITLAGCVASARMGRSQFVPEDWYEKKQIGKTWKILVTGDIGRDLLIFMRAIQDLYLMTSGIIIGQSCRNTVKRNNSCSLIQLLSFSTGLNNSVN